MNVQDYFDRYEFTREQLRNLLIEAETVARISRDVDALADEMLESLDLEKSRYADGDVIFDAYQCLPPRHWNAVEMGIGVQLPAGIPEHPELSMRLLQPGGMRYVEWREVLLMAYRGGPDLAQAMLVIDLGDAVYAFTGFKEWKSLYEDGELLSVSTMIERWAADWKKV